MRMCARACFCLLLLCFCLAVALVLLCYCFAVALIFVALLLLCFCFDFAFACFCIAFALLLRCFCLAFALLLLCFCFAFCIYLAFAFAFFLCFCFAVALVLLSYCFAIALLLNSSLWLLNSFLLIAWLSKFPLRNLWAERQTKTENSKNGKIEKKELRLSLRWDMGCPHLKELRLEAASFSAWYREAPPAVLARIVPIMFYPNAQCVPNLWSHFNTSLPVKQSFNARITI